MPLATQSLPIPKMLRGSVVTNRRRCGKPTCHCVTGDSWHETTVLSYAEAGRTHFLSLPETEVAVVRAATEHYHQARAKLDAQAGAGLAELVALLGQRGRR